MRYMLKDVDEGILFYAFRYSLSRMTYVVSETVGCILNNWECLSGNTKRLMVKEINEAIGEGCAGMACDIKQWQRVLARFEEEKK